jgi:putative endonuclease
MQEDEVLNRWCVYILRCKNNTLYTGITNDLQRRFKLHLEGKGAKYTRANPPVYIAYTEPVGSRSEALKREAAIKKMTKQKKEELINKNECLHD